MNNEIENLDLESQLEDEMRKKIRKFEKIVNVKLEGLSTSMKSGKIKAEQYQGGFMIYFQRDLRDGSAVFTIEEPQTAISFEFVAENASGIRRNIYDSSDDGFFSDLEDNKLITTRLVSIEEVDDLISIMRNPNRYIDGPPQSLVCVNPQEDTLLRNSNLSTWNLPHAS